MSAVLLPERRTEMICAAVERCAGIDVGKTFLAVCVMTGPLGTAGGQQITGAYCCSPGRE
jgi:hypothetical protein